MIAVLCSFTIVPGLAKDIYLDKSTHTFFYTLCLESVVNVDVQGARFKSIKLKIKF